MTDARRRKPRIGFVGVGWIGLHRMKAVLDSGSAEVMGVVEPSQPARERALEAAPHATSYASFEELLSHEPDGVVIATPSAQHAAQCVTALRRGIAVFCQKPLARSAEETAEVVACARDADRLLAVDFSYRHTEACRALKRLVEGGELGNVYAARFVFHNAYGPDKPWYLDRAQAGGGCLVDLGIHLVDLALWLLPDSLRRVRGARYAQGERLSSASALVEDHAIATLELHAGTTVEIACSWRAHAGADAVIEGELFGTRGGARFHNVAGSFYDFAAQRFQGTTRRTLVEPPDSWGGRAIVEWACTLHDSNKFDARALQIVRVAEALDAIAHTPL